MRPHFAANLLARTFITILSLGQIIFVAGYKLVKSDRWPASDFLHPIRKGGQVFQ